MNTITNHEYSRTYFLTAAECDASGCMPLTLIIERLIELATEHANMLHIGYADLLPLNIGWVLSRTALKVTRWLPYNNDYTITTWIEDINRRFSNRCFVITDAEGNEIAHARTMWVTINFTTREAGNLDDVLANHNLPVGNRTCPIKRFARVPQLPAETVRRHYTFRYCDIDVNRHVNTVRYIALILNSWSLQHFDSHTITDFDIAFHHECHFGQQVQIRIIDTPSDTNPHNLTSSVCEIVKCDEDSDTCDESLDRAVSVAIAWQPRETN